MPAKRSPKNTPRRTDRISSFHHKMTIGFLVVSSLLVVLIFYFAIAEVHITITPAAAELETTFEAELLPNVESTLAGTNIIPATISTGIEERTQTISIEGGTPVPAVVTGEVTIINTYSQTQPLIATTRLLSPDGKLFRIKEYVSVPAGGSVTASVYADEPGAEYELAPTRFTIPGLWEGLQDQIYAENSEPFTGGEILEKTVTNTMLAAKAEEFIQQVTANLEQTTTPAEGMIQITKITGEPTWESTATAGDTVDSFQITAQIPVTTITFAQGDLESVAINNLIAETPTYQQFVTADFSSLEYTIRDIDTQNTTASLQARVRGKSASRLKKEDLSITHLQGKQYQEVLSYIESLPGVATASITFTPSWLKKVPSLQDHVFIEISGDGN